MNLKLSIVTIIIAFSVSAYTQNIKTDTFMVYGNCGMCKATIEKALKSKDGIEYRNWDKETKKIVVKYDADVITLNEIHKKIAASGYDTEKARANDQVYNSLHKCCQYERAEMKAGE